MDTQNSSAVDVPNMKLAKVGTGRERKRGGAGWLGGRGAGSGFGALGGAEAGAGAGGFLGTGMSLAKILAVLLVSAGVSAGAWKAGGMLAVSSATAGKGAPKVFADKDSGKYADTSGVIKADHSIPNSLGYVNNDGLTDEQRAANKAAADEAARKAAEEAQRKADEDAKNKALADAKAAAAAAPAAPAEAANSDSLKKGLTPGKFGGFSSSFGGGHGGGLSGGAGLSGGISRNFGSSGDLGPKGQKGNLSAFAPAKVASARAGAGGHSASGKNAFGQLANTAATTRGASGTAQTETAATKAGSPFDGSNPGGSSIAGPGLGNGGATGPADGGGSVNPGGGGGSNGGPTTPAGPACTQAGYQPDINGNCVPISTPTAVKDAPYQGLINAVMILMGIAAALSLLAVALRHTLWGTPWATAICLGIAAIGAVVSVMGIMIASMTHGDLVIGGIVGVIGAFISYSAIATMGMATTSTQLITGAARIAIASAVGEMLSASTKIPKMQ
ncbi:MAG: hypothetical protein ACHQ49_01605 [Elusimicrobiota bacterium]